MKITGVPFDSFKSTSMNATSTDDDEEDVVSKTFVKQEPCLPLLLSKEDAKSTASSGTPVSAVEEVTGRQGSESLVVETAVAVGETAGVQACGEMEDGVVESVTTEDLSSLDEEDGDFLDMLAETLDGEFDPALLL